MNPIHDLTKVDIEAIELPKDKTKVEIVPEEDPSDYLAAPWIWKVVEGDRSRVINISFRPEEGPTGGVRYEKWVSEPYKKECVMVRLHYRLVYQDGEGEEKFLDKEFMMYTGIEYPSGKDPQVEEEVAARVNLAIKAFTAPVIGAMDPNQRDDSVWNKVEELVHTKRFWVKRSYTSERKNNYLAATVYFGTDLECPCQIKKINDMRELIHTGSRYALGSKVNSQTEGTKPMQVPFKHYSAVEIPCFDQSQELSELRDMPAAKITANEITSRGMDPKQYMERLRQEITRDQKHFDKICKKVVVPTGWFAQHFTPSIKLSEEYSSFISGFKPGDASPWERIKGRLGLGKGQRYERERIQDTIERTRLQISEKEAVITAAPVATDAERQAKAKLESERDSLKEHLNKAQANLHKLETDLGKKRGELEGVIATLEAIQQRMENHHAQIQKLLNTEVGSGGLGIEEAASTFFANEAERGQWRLIMANNAKSIQTNGIYLQKAIDGLEKAGLDFNLEKQAVSPAKMADGVAQIGVRVQRLRDEATAHAQNLQATDMAYTSDRADEAAKKAHQDALSQVEQSQRSAQNLIKEVMEEMDSVHHLLNTPLNDIVRAQLNDNQGRLVGFYDNLTNLHQTLGQDLYNYRIGDDRLDEN